MFTNQFLAPRPARRHRRSLTPINCRFTRDLVDRFATARLLANQDKFETGTHNCTRQRRLRERFHGIKP